MNTESPAPPRCAVCAGRLVASPLVADTTIVSATSRPWECQTSWCGRTYWLPQEGR